MPLSVNSGAASPTPTVLSLMVLSPSLRGPCTSPRRQSTRGVGSIQSLRPAPPRLHRRRRPSLLRPEAPPLRFQRTRVEPEVAGGGDDLPALPQVAEALAPGHVAEGVVVHDHATPAPVDDAPQVVDAAVDR